jgi:hypothetical protein
MGIHDLEQIKELAFQTQICYMALDGSQKTLVMTRVLKVSSDRTALEAQANTEMLRINAVQQASKLARIG